TDPCECIFSHEALMRRLLSALRDSQADCTDTECLESSGDGSVSGGMTLSMLLALWGVMAVILFMSRPASLRNNSDRDLNEKPRLNGDNNPPPPPS
ncbi:UNVERIFIED_CONTAM: Small integral membrane protein 14, partial [Eudyptes robustus]